MQLKFIKQGAKVRVQKSSVPVLEIEEVVCEGGSGRGRASARGLVGGRGTGGRGGGGGGGWSVLGGIACSQCCVGTPGGRRPRDKLACGRGEEAESIGRQRRRSELLPQGSGAEGRRGERRGERREERKGEREKSRRRKSIRHLMDK